MACENNVNENSKEILRGDSTINNIENKNGELANEVSSKSEIKIYFEKSSLRDFESGKYKSLAGFVISKSNQNIKACYFYYDGSALSGDAVDKYATLTGNRIEQLPDFKINGLMISFSHRVIYFGEEENCPHTKFINGELKDTLFATITVKTPCKEDVLEQGEWILAEMPKINYDRIPELKKFIDGVEKTNVAVESSNSITEGNGKTGIKTITEIKLALLDGRLAKAELLLGKPDEVGQLGHWSKSYMLYFNKVIDNDGQRKHLVLFIRKKDTSREYTSSYIQVIEEIYTAVDGERICFGIHCIRI